MKIYQALKDSGLLGNVVFTLVAIAFVVWKVPQEAGWWTAFFVGYSVLMTSILSAVCKIVIDENS